MNTAIRPLLSLLALATLCPQFAAAQGSLTPPAGPPVASMKTLDQMEARTPVLVGQPGVTLLGSGTTIAINQPGSYYLTGNLSFSHQDESGIYIQASNVTLDLNGFTVSSVSGSLGTAVEITGHNVRIRNGNIKGPVTHTGGSFSGTGWGYGISGSGEFATVSDVTVTGINGTGIYLPLKGSRVTGATVNVCAQGGIFAESVIDSLARITSLTAISAQNGGVVSNCIAECVGSGTGISATGGVVTNSKGTSNSGTGIQAEQASNCTGTSTSGTGLVSVGATNCTGVSSSGAFGLQVTGTASFCRGTRTGGTAIQAAIAVACTSGGGTITGNKQLGTP